MQNEANNRQAPEPGKVSAFQTIDLPTQVAQLKGEESWQKTGRSARTLYKGEPMRLILNVMQAGSEIKPHQAPGPISVQVLEGQIRFSTEQSTVVLAKGALLILPQQVRHWVEALEESAFLLTVAPLSDQV